MAGFTSVMKTLLLKGRGGKMPKSQTVSQSVRFTSSWQQREGKPCQTFLATLVQLQQAKKPLLPRRGWEWPESPSQQVNKQRERGTV